MNAPHANPLQPPGPSNGAPHHPHATTPRANLSLWTGVLGGAIAWALQLQVGYALSRFSHEHPWLTGAHHAVSLVAALLALCAALLAWRHWTRLGPGDPDSTAGGPVPRARFLAALGVFSNATFALVILANWIPIFFLDPAWY